MANIQCLSPHVADLIAAGEVVERPASVVKELAENAVDAGASAVFIEIRRGGMELIRITDDGCGIAREELPTAFLRHATSKLRTEQDLAAIGTLGFRGEALAAVAAVSHVEITSRAKNASGGAALKLDAGKPGSVTDAACGGGTVISVRDLFYNTPARLKFMKKDSAEAAAVHTVVQHLALSHPEVSFRLIKDGEELLHTPGDGRLLSAVYAAHGRDFALSLIPVKGGSGDIRCEGFITKPLAGRGSRSLQSFFVNGRLVKSATLTSALEEGYRNQIMKGKFPGCVLHISLPVTAVDVNVHPAKTVVKFLNDKAVFDAVYYTVLDALNGKESIPTAKSVSSQVNPRGDFYQTMTAEQFRAKQSAPVKGGAKPAESAAQTRAAPKAPQTAFRTQVPPVKSDMRPAVRAEDPEKFPFPRVDPVETKLVDRKSGAETPVFTIRPPKKELFPASAVEKQPVSPIGSVKSVEKTAEFSTKAERPVENPAPMQAAIPLGEEAEQVTLTPAPAPWRIAGEVLKTYIVCEEGETVHLIDKHAAHERVLFDRLKAGSYPIMAQELLSPIAAEIGSEYCAALMAREPLLREFGFTCEDFGPGALLLRSVPSDIDAADAVSALEMLAERLLQCRSTDPAAARDEMLHTVACKAAVKAGMNSGEKELRVLVEKVQSGEIRYCPHGRPVEVTLSKYQLEKMFKRA